MQEPPRGYATARSVIPHSHLMPLHGDGPLSRDDKPVASFHWQEKQM